MLSSFRSFLPIRLPEHMLHIGLLGYILARDSAFCSHRVMLPKVGITNTIYFLDMFV